MENNEATPIKVSLAAELAGVSMKTLYNWIADGLIKTVTPGYVLMSDVEKAKEIVNRQKSVTARMKMMGITRDERGRFIEDKTRKFFIFRELD